MFPIISAVSWILTPVQDGWCHGIGCFDSGAHTSCTARYYRGLDESQALEKNDEVDRHFAYYSDMSVPVVMVGTDLQRTTGMTTAQLVRQDYSLGHMNETDRLMLLNQFNTAYETGAAGAQARQSRRLAWRLSHA